MADDLPHFVVPNVTKIRGLNRPGTPWATSACCGMTFTFIFVSCAECGFVFHISLIFNLSLLLLRKYYYDIAVFFIVTFFFPFPHSTLPFN